MNCNPLHMTQKALKTMYEFILKVTFEKKKVKALISILRKNQRFM